MCGIAGFVARKSGWVDDSVSLVRKMCNVMAHRGPDGEGVWTSEHRGVTLGHRRLSIIDLSQAASQPMHNEDGTVSVVFNGEIYNHAEIRRELLALGGHTWATDHSDTEVLIHGYEAWGIGGLLERLRGMFAIALYDSRRDEMWLVRDRMGVKPIYYHESPGGVLFGSEIKAILQHPGVGRNINRRGLVDYMTFMTVPAPNTLFEGIHKVPAGSLLHIDSARNVRLHRWYEVLDHVSPILDASDQELEERVLAELRTSVRYRQVSDVPVGVLLSGGVDSSTNAALFAESASDHCVRTFSVAYDQEFDSYKSELKYARMVAESVGADHHEVILSQNDLLSFLPRMTQLQDEPIGDPVCVPVYYVSKLARDKGVVVAQVGEGADELFCGYSSWLKQVRAQQMISRVPMTSAFGVGASALRAAGQEDSMLHELFQRASRGQPTFWTGSDAFTHSRKEKILSAGMREEFRSYTSFESISDLRQRWEAKSWDKHPLAWMTFVDLHVRLPELLLMRVDKMSMGVCLEGRVPFLDQKLVQLAMSIPGSRRTNFKRPKSILKNAVRGLIPDAVINRPKQGFGVPVHEWYLGSLGQESRKLLARFSKETGLFDGAYVDAMHDRREGYRLWHLYNVALWWQGAMGAPSERLV